MNNYLFCAYKSEEDYDNKLPYFAKIFKDHTKMKIFSSKHSKKDKDRYPNYVSMYWSIETS